MLLQTLVFHYLVDMVVAVPFTLALYALTRTDVPWPVRQRRFGCVFGGLQVAAWMIALRWGTGLFLASPAVPWLAVLFTVVSSCWAWQVLERVHWRARRS